MRNALIVVWMLMCSIAAADAQVSVGVAAPGLSIGINLPGYPQLVPVPGYPVYYAPQVDANYFFYDGMYWVYDGENWYASTWYNGPWALVVPDAVPLFVLRVPVRYYRRPPVYFRGWRADFAPRWGEHWGRGWEQHHRRWDRWDRGSVPARAPLPLYQRQYSGSRYPHVEQQQAYHARNYRYQPRDTLVRQHYPAQSLRGERMNAPERRQGARQDRASPPLEQHRSGPSSATQERTPGAQEPFPQRERSNAARSEQARPMLNREQHAPHAGGRGEQHGPEARNHDNARRGEQEGTTGRGEQRGSERGR